MIDETYGPAKWFKIFCWIMAVICAVFVVLLPGTIVMVWLATKPRVVLKDDRIEVTWFGTRSIPWSDISQIEWARAAGALGAAMRPLSYRAGVKGSRGNIAIGAFENGDRIVEVLKQKTGLALS